MKQINLEEILSKFENEEDLNTTILKAMRSACEATVDLCAENAEIKDIKIDYTGVRAGGYYIIKEVDKGSILKTKNQIV